jgi:predicted dehydrogenase
MSATDGMTYAPQGRPDPVCGPGEFPFAAVGLDHGHIYGMCNGLVEAGGTLAWVYDPDPAKVAAFLQRHPGVAVARSEDEVLGDPSVSLVAGAKIPSDRADLGIRVMEHDKDYFCDKPPLTTLDQLDEARRTVAATGRKYAVYFSERLHVESAVFAGQLIGEGSVGRVIQVLGMGPHRISAPSRPAWFWDPQRFGGILCDIGSHQIEQILHFSGADGGRITSSRVANYAHKDHPGFEDFGDLTMVTDNGAAGYCRVDWFTPEGLGTWVTAVRSSSGPRATSSCASTSTWAGTRAGTTCTWSTRPESTTFRSEARWDIRTSVSSSWTALNAQSGP